MPGQGDSARWCRGGKSFEAHIPTERTAPLEAAWLSQAHVDPGWAGCLAIAPPEGPSTAVGLIGRFSDHATFSALRRQGSRTRSGPVSVWFLPEPDSSRPRLAFAIGRRVGPAVARNRIRRRLRHAAADLARSAHLPLGAYLVQVDPAVTSLTFTELADHLGEAVSKIARRVG